jgi:DNA-binding ferritin-like protein
MQLSTNVQFLLETQLQFRILHWQTKGYARHKAFGKIYSTLDDLIDSFTETAMGKYGRFSLSENEKTIKLQNISDLELSLFIKTIKGKLVGMSSDLTDKDSDLLNIRDEMLAEINKLSYLLTLE